MSKNAASESKLGTLHDKLADCFTQALDGEVVISGDGEEVVLPPSPQMLNSCRAFLKDNDIIAIPTEDNRVGNLDKKLQRFREDSKQRFKDQENVVPIVSNG